MNEKPILFNGDMVRAILEGRKFQTRMPVKPQPSSGLRKSVFCSSGLEDGHGREVKIPYQPGDILYVREMWGKDKHGKYHYRADYPEHDCEPYPIWHTSTHMPREAARIFLKIADVRVERVQSITEEDARAEGFVNTGAFREYWDTLAMKQRGADWYTNEWVFVIEFERVTP